MSAEDDVPMLIFEGNLADVTFLVSLLASGGIEANVADPSRAWPHLYRVFVRRRDSSDAAAVVEQFTQRGARND